MKVLVITGSPHKKGTTAVLAEQFIQGAQESGHQVERFDAAFREVHPCIACERCHTTQQGCVFSDDMALLNPMLLEADAVCFVSPVYYSAMSAQIRAVIDRFYANDEALHKNKKSCLLLAMADSSVQTAEGAIRSYQGTVGYLEWEDLGTISACGCSTAEDVVKTEYPRQAYELGKNLA